MDLGLCNYRFFDQLSLCGWVFVVQKAVPVSVEKTQLEGLIIDRGKDLSLLLQQTRTGSTHTGQ